MVGVHDAEADGLVVGVRDQLDRRAYLGGLDQHDGEGVVLHDVVGLGEVGLEHLVLADREAELLSEATFGIGTGSAVSQADHRHPLCQGADSWRAGLPLLSVADERHVRCGVDP